MFTCVITDEIIDFIIKHLSNNYYLLVMQFVKFDTGTKSVNYDHAIIWHFIIIYAIYFFCQSQHNQ